MAAISPQTTGMMASSALVRSWSIMGESSMPVTGEDRARTMGRPHDGSDRELQRSSIPGELGKPIDRRVQHLRSEHAGAQGVIALGNLDVPDLLLPHGAHGGGGSTTLSRRFRGALRPSEVNQAELGLASAAIRLSRPGGSPHRPDLAMHGRPHSVTP